MSQKHTPATRIIIAYIMPIIAILGVVFNFAFLFVIYRVRKMRTVINLYLSQLSVCDIGYLVVATTRLVHDYFLSPEYDFEQPTGTGCHTFDFLIYFFYFTGVHFICAVIIDRYFAICRPMQYKTFDRFRARNISKNINCLLGYGLCSCNDRTCTDERNQYLRYNSDKVSK